MKKSGGVIRKINISSIMMLSSQIIVAGGFTIETLLVVSTNNIDHSLRKVCIMTVQNAGVFLEPKGMTSNVFF